MRVLLISVVAFPTNMFASAMLANSGDNSGGKMVENKMVAAIAVLILAVVLMGCGGSSPYDVFVAKLESENIDPTHYVVQVVLRAQCEAHSETGFMENYHGERKFIGASNAKIEPLILQYNEEENEVLSATILAMRATVDGGIRTRVFCESLGIS